ncbi:DNA gyrase subunit A [Candidatus Gracilibacteria bacterium]|nr:DNA gyrase subunit A [Candidatus Gracilibacteria bacterium]
MAESKDPKNNPEKENQTQKDKKNEAESEQGKNSPLPKEEGGVKTELFADYTLHNISEEMQTAYLDYAMSVIVSRALPDVRDGLKPVQRRILYAMHDLGLSFSSSFRKSAFVVGEVLGKYHPHGDSPVYQAMVRMAQDFALRYPLVKGQGNFGSIDGDNAAAMRYTEAKMDKITDELMADIEKETVPWGDNYDGRVKEPLVLPAKVPQLLLNGSTGIAVGMATSIPPHNLGELVEAIQHLLDNEEASVEDLLQFIKGPDFPTGGIIYDQEAIKQAYLTGRGGVVMRAKANIEEKKGGRFVIIVNEIPYQVNKADLVTKIAELVRDKKIIGISDVRDESNREGIRIVIELKKESYPKKILNQLFKLTPMQQSFNYNMIALAEGLQPKLLDLKQILSYFIDHRKIVLTNRTKYELRINKERAHILEGLRIALDHIDAIIDTIRKSDTKEEAHDALMKKFKLTDVQSKAILEMKLQTLAGLERKKIDNEYDEKMKIIAELEAILKDPKKIIKLIKDELKDVKARFADERKTEVHTEGVGKIENKDTIPNEPMIVMLSKENYIKRMPPSTFRTQNRGGKGVIGATTKEEDEVAIIREAMTHDDILFFTNLGRVFRQPVYDIPVGSRTAKGQAIVNLLQLQPNEFVTAMLSSGMEKIGEFMVMSTTKGTIKKTPVADFKNVRKSGLIAIKLREGDYLKWIKLANKNDQVMIVTKEGKSIRFSENDISPTGRNSMGVRGIKLKAGDEVVSMDIVKDPAKTELLVVMENGLGKCTRIADFRDQTRGGTGVKCANVTAKTGKIVGAYIIEDNAPGDLIIISKHGQIIRLPLKNIPSQGRATQGVYLMRMNEGDTVASASALDFEDIEVEENKTEDKTAQPEQETLVK